jgi:proteic killer suppression protein
MEIIFKDSYFQEQCNNQKLLVKTYGKDMAKKIRRRLDDLQAVTTLEDTRSLFPGRCHELRHNRAGQLSLDLVHPQRLIFEPASDPIPRKLDGGIDWTQVTAIRILSIEDPHPRGRS